MADVQHAGLTDPLLHEPKGISSAAADTLYVADGNGSGSWLKVPYAVLDSGDFNTAIQADLDDGTLEVNASTFYTTVIADVSTAGSVLIPVPGDGTVVGASVVLGGAITTADASVSFLNSAGASMGTPVTVPFTSSAKGDQYAFTATGNNTLSGPTFIEVATDGASDTAQPLYVTVEIAAQIN